MAPKSCWPLTFERVTKNSTIFRRLNGSCPTLIAFNKVWWIKNTFFPTYTLFCVLISIYSVLYHDFKHKNYADAIRNGTMSIIGMTVILKHLLVFCNRKSIRQIITIINKDYEAAADYMEEEKNIILKFSQTGARICNFWVIVVIIASLMFPMRAIALMSYYFYKGQLKLVPIMDLSYPFIDEYKNIPVVFWILFLSCLCFAVYGCTVYVGFDPLLLVIVAHTCGQLEVISNRLLKIFSTGKTLDEINEDLKRMNIKLMEIYSVINIVQNNFLLLYEFIMKTTTFLISFSAFQIIEGLKCGETSVEFISLFFGSLLHFYSPCYYSDLLMDKNELLRQAIYTCGWEMQTDVKIRKTLLLMLTRTTKPLVIRTVFMPICLDTFAEMTRQAYGIYNIMNAAWG